MNNKGHVLLVVIIILVIIGVLALSTWGFLQNKSKSNTIETSTTKLQETTLTPQKPVINTEDQQKTEITVEQTPETINVTKPQQQETPAEVNPPSNN